MAVRIDADGEQYTRSTGLSTVTNWSVACWARLMVDRLTTTVIWQIDNGSGTNRLRMNAWNGSAMTFQTDSGGWFGLVGHTMAIGEWTYIALSATSTPGQARVRIRPASSSTFTTVSLAQTDVTINASTLRLGAGSNTGEWLNGSLAAIKIWDAALSEPELEQESWTYQPQRTTNLRGWYPLLSPSTVDLSGNGQTLSGGVGTALDDGPPIAWSQGRPRVVLPLSVPVPISLGDSGAAGEQLAAAATVTVLETASSADSVTTGVPKALTDGGSAVNALATAVAAMLTQTATATDTLTPSANVGLADVAAGTDSVAQLLFKSFGDAGAATDAMAAAIDRYITGAGAPYMAWRAGAPEVRWSAGPPSMRYAARPPSTEEV